MSSEVTVHEVLQEIAVLVEVGRATLAATILKELLYRDKITAVEYVCLVEEYKQSNRIDLSDGGRYLQ